MKQILWFRRDLRVEDSALLHHACGEVLPIFIFDRHILSKLPSNDRRVSFIYQSVERLKKSLQAIGLDLAIFYGSPQEIFTELAPSFDEVLCSCDFDAYAIERDRAIEAIMPMRRFYDSFLLHPSHALKADGTPYRLFTPFFKSLEPLWQSVQLEEYTHSKNLTLTPYDFYSSFSLASMGFEKQELPAFLSQEPKSLLDAFIPKLSTYQEGRDYFAKEATSNLSVHLRFGLLSPRQIFNALRPHEGSGFYIRELFWREFYNAMLYHFPQSAYENFNAVEIAWSHNQDHFNAWKEGRTGVPIIDASMRHLNATGMMHNRLRMICASFLTKNLLLPWQWGEGYFALKLLDYEASSNIGSWQWSASTGADSVPYFRIFNPYTQSAKFDKEATFIKENLPALRDTPSAQLHKEGAIATSLFLDYPPPIVDIKRSREEAIEVFKRAK
jgi:deoxyribodipyrimidine photo-lyase